MRPDPGAPSPFEAAVEQLRQARTAAAVRRVLRDARHVLSARELADLRHSAAMHPAMHTDES